MDYSFLFHILIKEIDTLAEQVITRVASKYAVIFVGINQLAEILVGLNKGIHIYSCVLIVHIIIGQTMNKQEGTTQLFCTGNGAYLIIARCILLWCTHKTLRINGVIEAPAGRRSNCHATTEDGTSL